MGTIIWRGDTLQPLIRQTQLLRRLENKVYLHRGAHYHIATRYAVPSVFGFSPDFVFSPGRSCASPVIAPFRIWELAVNPRLRESFSRRQFSQVRFCSFFSFGRWVVGKAKRTRQAQPTFRFITTELFQKCCR